MIALRAALKASYKEKNRKNPTLEHIFYINDTKKCTIFAMMHSSKDFFWKYCIEDGKYSKYSYDTKQVYNNKMLRNSISIKKFNL